MRFLSTLAVLALAVTARGQQMTINTPPSLVQCVPIAITWTGGSAPFFLTVIEPGNPSNILLQLGTFSSSPYTWLPSLPAGTPVAFQISDSTGTTASSAGVSITAGTSTDCVGQSQSGGGGSSTAPGTTSSSAGGNSTATAPGGTTTSSSSSAPGSTSTNLISSSSTVNTAPGSTSSAPATSTSAATTAPPASTTGAAVMVKAPVLGGAIALLLGAAVIV